MRTGTLISAAGHAAIIAAAVFGLPWISPAEREAIRVTEVSFISEAEFEAAASGGTAAPDAEAPAVILPPEVAEAPDLPEAAPEPPQAEPEAPEQEVATLAPQFEPEATLRSPATELSSIAPQVTSPEPPRAVTAPRSRPSARIEPVPVPPPPEPARPAEAPVAETVPEPQAETPREPEVAAAPPEAAPEPVAEPSPVAPLALQRSAPPPRRPERVAAAPAPPAAEPAQPRTAAPEPAEPRQSPAELVRELAAATPATPPTEPSVTEPTPPAGASSLPVGPPMTGSEKDGLKFAIQACWNVPAGLRNAEDLRITVAAELAADGALIPASVRLVEPASIGDARFQVAYDAARRALIRCSPYTGLPRAKFGQWRNIEVVFNPEGMVSW